MEGAVLDVAVDIRQGDPNFVQHVAVEFSGENKTFLLPEVGAHGVLVLTGSHLGL